MYEVGIVKSIEGAIAKVMILRQGSPCDHCTQDTCTIPEKGVETEAINAAGAKVGQKVKVVMKSYAYIKGAMLIYVLPVIALIAGAILGKIYLPSIWEGIDTDLLAALGGFLAFFASLILVKIISGRMEKKSEYKSVIESIVEG
ncbi:MAG: SoxR reducing system RseC family protein [Planctomycetota bacterium]|jgi:sigma-E factor negative regulatory protein RseC